MIKTASLSVLIAVMFLALITTALAYDRTVVIENFTNWG